MSNSGHTVLVRVGQAFACGDLGERHGCLAELAAVLHAASPARMRTELAMPSADSLCCAVSFPRHAGDFRESASEGDPPEEGFLALEQWIQYGDQPFEPVSVADRAAHRIGLG